MDHIHTGKRQLDSNLNIPRSKSFSTLNQLSSASFPLRRVHSIPQQLSQPFFSAEQQEEITEKLTSFSFFLKNIEVIHKNCNDIDAISYILPSWNNFFHKAYAYMVFAKTAFLETSLFLTLTIINAQISLLLLLKTLGPKFVQIDNFVSFTSITIVGLISTFEFILLTKLMCFMRNIPADGMPYVLATHNYNKAIARLYKTEACNKVITELSRSISSEFFVPYSGSILSLPESVGLFWWEVAKFLSPSEMNIDRKACIYIIIQRPLSRMIEAMKKLVSVQSKAPEKFDDDKPKIIDLINKATKEVAYIFVNQRNLLSDEEIPQYLKSIMHKNNIPSEELRKFGEGYLQYNGQQECQ